MSIKYNGKLIAGKYKTQIIPSADTVNEGKIKIATQLEVDEGTSNNSAVTPLYLSKKQDKLTAGTGIEITEDNVINNTQTSAEWGNIQGNIVNQSDLIDEFDKKQDVITDIDTIRSNAENAANNSLSNLSEAGQAIVDYKANIDLNNLSETGEARFNDKANVNLDNLSEAGEKHFLNKQQITNCLTEVPQRIKYTLENGILTIKAGTVVIVPYGTEDLSSTYPIGSTFINDNFKVYDTQFADGKFFVWAETQNDIAAKFGYNDLRVFWIYLSTNNIEAFPIIYTYSSDTAPTAQQYMYWYDTANNLVKETVNTGSTWGSDLTLPILIAQTGSGEITSVQQVFNGMGYIGSTVWVDKGVKGLIPNGRNADGSLRNIEWTNDSAKIITNDTLYRVNHIVIGNTQEFTSYINMSEFQGVFDSPPPVLGAWGTYYNDNENIMYINYNNQWHKTNRFLCAGISVSSDKITSLKPKLPFRAVDYNDKSNISSWSLPSTKYIDLALGASGTSYTAPANGWFCINKVTGISGFVYLVLGNNTSGIRNNPSVYNNSSAVLSAFVPAIKGDTIGVSYSATGDTTLFRFIYAQGEV